MQLSSYELDSLTSQLGDTFTTTMNSYNATISSRVNSGFIDLLAENKALKTYLSLTDPDFLEMFNYISNNPDADNGTLEAYHRKLKIKNLNI